MQQDKIVVGLDIGTTKICAVVGKLNEYGKLEVIGMGTAPSEGVKEGVVSNISKTIDGIDAAIKQAEQDADIDIHVINVGIAGKSIRSAMHRGGITRKASDDEITMEDVDRLTQDMYRIVTDPGFEIVHVMPQHYTVDYEENIKDPVGMSGVKLEANFHIIMSHVNNLRNIRKCIERVGMETESMILEPLASSLAVLSEEEREAGVCLVDIGGGTTDVAIFHDNIIRHTAIIPFGGSVITSDIKHGCAVMAQQAEMLKVKFGRSMPEKTSEREFISIKGLRGERQPKEISVKNLAHIIHARVEDIIELVLVEIEKSGYKDRLAGGIVLTGGGALLKNLQQLMELKTGLDTRIGYPNEYLGKCKHEEVKSPIYATAIGLVLAGFRSLDDRDTWRSERQINSGTGNAKKAGSTESGGDFLKNFLRKTKELLIDDFDDTVK